MRRGLSSSGLSSSGLSSSSSSGLSSSGDTAVDKAPSDVIVFWFGDEWYAGGIDAEAYADKALARWFFGGPELDAECREFIPLIRAAGAGRLSGAAWDDVPGLVARLVLLDQRGYGVDIPWRQTGRGAAAAATRTLGRDRRAPRFSRNGFRGTSEAFAYPLLRRNHSSQTVAASAGISWPRWRPSPPPLEYRGRGGAATPLNIHVVAAASPRPDSAEYAPRNNA